MLSGGTPRQGRALKVQPTDSSSRLPADPASTPMQRRTLMAPTLPTPIADYVEAIARLDVDAMLKPCAADAVIHDNGGVHHGLAEIRSLLEEAVIPVKAIFTPDTVRHDNGQVVVEGPAHGDFPG